MYKTRRQGNVSIVTMPITDEAFEQWFLFTSDRHWDNPHSDHAMQIRHMEEAVKREAGIIDLGDLFVPCKASMTSGPARTRSGQSTNGDYLDAWSRPPRTSSHPTPSGSSGSPTGNHEASIRHRHETDLIHRLVRALNRRGGDIHRGGISGWIQFRFLDQHRHVRQYKAWYHHGYGGGGPVTRGVIQSNRKAVYVPDANFVLSGHVHEEWNLTIQRTRLSDGGVQYQDEQLHLQVPTYKDEYGDGSGGWHVGTGKPPKPLGALWLVFRKGRKKPCRSNLSSRGPNELQPRPTSRPTTPRRTSLAVEYGRVGRGHADQADKSPRRGLNRIDRLNYTGQRTADYNIQTAALLKPRYAHQM
jgi:hypothetical protein